MQEAKKLLFIDRDGTIIVEPPVDYQIDSLEKLEFLPGVISALSSIKKLDYGFVMASNQDGLGTDSFPEPTFWGAHNKMLKTLEGEGVNFDDILIDRTFEHENAPTRKPQIGMFTEYLSGDYDLENSYVIGDRITDVMLAKNLGAKAILLQKLQIGKQILKEKDLEPTCALVTDSWAEIAAFLRSERRVAKISRQTKETKILVELDLDGEKMGEVSSKVSTGLNFLDHMIDQISHHSGIALKVEVEGDLHVDEHHTMEDTAIVIGEAFLQALGSKRGIERYGFALPMDDCEAKVLLDFGGRIEFIWNVQFEREMIGDVPTEMFKHFFKSFAEAAKCNLHIEAKGENEHHKIEGIFKALARAIKMAINRNPFSDELPSSKGML